MIYFLAAYIWIRINHTKRTLLLFLGAIYQTLNFKTINYGNANLPFDLNINILKSVKYKTNLNRECIRIIQLKYTKISDIGAKFTVIQYNGFTNDSVNTGFSAQLMQSMTT